MSQSSTSDRSSSRAARALLRRRERRDRDRIRADRRRHRRRRRRDGHERSAPTLQDARSTTSSPGMFPSTRVSTRRPIGPAFSPAGISRVRKRIGEPRLRRSRRERLLLALVRRPARQPDDLEGRAHAAVGIGEALGIDFHHPPQRRAPQRRAAALDQRIGRAHAAQIVHQRERRGVAHGDAVDVGDRQREARALQQRAEIAQIGERRDARRDAALDLGLGRGERLAQLGQAFAADHRRQEQPVRLERAADLDQRARQVVDELQRQRRHHEIERAVAERQRLLVGDDRSASPATCAASGSTATTAPTRPPSRGAPHRPACRDRPRDRTCAAPPTSRSARSSATRSSRNVAGPSAAARARRARSSGRSKIRGCGIALHCTSKRAPAARTSAHDPRKDQLPQLLADPELRLRRPARRRSCRWCCRRPGRAGGPR